MRERIADIRHHLRIVMAVRSIGDFTVLILDDLRLFPGFFMMRLSTFHILLFKLLIRRSILLSALLLTFLALRNLLGSICVVLSDLLLPLLFLLPLLLQLLLLNKLILHLLGLLFTLVPHRLKVGVGLLVRGTSLVLLSYGKGCIFVTI